jgi:hypothetical protein
MQEEAAEERVDRQSQKPLLVDVCEVTPENRDVALLKSNEPAVGNGDAMGVAAEIAQRVFRYAEWSLGVDDPVVTESQAKPCGEDAWLGNWRLGWSIAHDPGQCVEFRLNERRVVVPRVSGMALLWQSDMPGKRLETRVRTQRVKTRVGLEDEHPVRAFLVSLLQIL